MITRTKRADELLMTVILFVITAVCWFLAWIFLANGKVGFSVIILIVALIGTIITGAGICTILIHRLAERKEI